MKKILSIALALCLLCLGAAGCSKKSPDSVDVIDLTKLSGTLVYAEVYNITNTPENYIGKTIKIRGSYSVSYYDLTKQYYHAVVIQDAAACCASGLEFQWAGEHAYPDDYPEDGALIEVTGVFGSYKELGQTYYSLATDKLTVL